MTLPTWFILYYIFFFGYLKCSIYIKKSLKVSKGSKATTMTINTGVQNDCHVKWCACRLSVTLREPLVEQDLPIPPEHLIPHGLVNILYIIVLLSFFLKAIVLYVLWLTTLFTPLVYSNLSYIRHENGRKWSLLSLLFNCF
jgi:hypothetical protein